jgi:hypothetical protein
LRSRKLRGSVVARCRLEDDSFELGQRAAAETKCGLEPLESEFAGVERPSQFVECRSLVVEYLVARSIEQDQVSRAPESMREAHVSFAVCSVESLERQDDALLRLKPLENGAREQFAGTFLDVGVRDPTGQQRSYPAGRERRSALLDNSLGEPCGLG